MGRFELQIAPDVDLGELVGREARRGELLLERLAQVAARARVEHRGDPRALALTSAEQAAQHQGNDSGRGRDRGTGPARVPHGAVANDGPAALAIEGLTASQRVGWFARRAVLTGVDLGVARGTTLGLVGTNGAGKSTLLGIAAGVERPSGGRVLVLGGSPAEAAVRRRIGYLPEDSPFPPEVRALEVLVLLGTLRGLGAREARRRGRELLERVGLAAEHRTPLGRFSRGMLRRFGLAQAVLHEPELALARRAHGGPRRAGPGGFRGAPGRSARARSDGRALLAPGDGRHAPRRSARGAPRRARGGRGIARGAPPGRRSARPLPAPRTGGAAAVNTGLVRLALRRSLAGGPWLVALAFVAWSASWAPSEALGGLLTEVDPERVARP